MNKYLQDTQYAANGIVELYMHEVLAHQEAELAFVTGAEAVQEWNAQLEGRDLLQAMLQPDFFDQLRAMTRNSAGIHESAERMFALEATLRTRQFAIQVLCGALLQIAKQGISVTYRNDWKTRCPDGRAIGSETLRNVIWQGRNHAMHYEENSPGDAVRECFTQLEQSFGAQFSLATQPSSNLSAHIINVLGWHTYAAYEKDMETLLGP